MLLGDDDRSIDLWLVGYETQTPAPDEDPEDFWLVLRAIVSDQSRTHIYDDLSLDVGELRQLAGWMHAVAMGRIGPDSRWNEAAVFFVEPDLAARLSRRVGDKLTLRWYFADDDAIENESENDASSRQPNYRARTVEVDTVPHQLEAASADLLTTLDALGATGLTEP